MSVLVNKDTRLVVQESLEVREVPYKSMHRVRHQCGSGVTPGKGGQKFQDSVPVFDTVQDAVDKEGANVAAIYVLSC